MKLVRSVLVHGCTFGSLDISLLGDKIPASDGGER